MGMTHGRIASSPAKSIGKTVKINLKYRLLLTNINLFPPLKALLSSYMNQKLIFSGQLDVLKVPNHGILELRFNKLFLVVCAKRRSSRNGP